MANVAATAQGIPRGVNGGNVFFMKTTIGTALANNDTLTVTLPDGFPKDALPFGKPNAYVLSTDTYTLDTDIGVITTHQRATGVTVYTASGNVAAGTILVQGYVGVG